MLKMIKKWMIFFLAVMLLTVQAVPGLSEAAEIQESDNHIPFRFASKEEGLELMLGNTEYYALNNENKLEFIMQKKRRYRRGVSQGAGE